MNIRFVFISLISVLFFCCSTEQMYQHSEVIKKSYGTSPADGVRYLYLKNVSGNVFIEKNLTPSVEIEIEKKAIFLKEDLLKVKADIVRDRNTLKIETVLFETANVSGVVVNYKLKIPSTVIIKLVEAVSGNIDINDATADYVETTSGNITLTNVTKTNSLISTSGNIVVNNSGGIDYVKTTNGNIEIKRTNQIKKANTVSGNISIDILDDIVNKEIETTSGNIDCYIDSQLNLVLILDKFSGIINNEFDGVIIGDDNDKRDVRIKTVSGNINIYRR